MLENEHRKQYTELHTKNDTGVQTEQYIYGGFIRM